MMNGMTKEAIVFLAVVVPALVACLMILAGMGVRKAVRAWARRRS